MTRYKTGKSAIDNLPRSLRIGGLDFQIERWSTVSACATRRYGEFSPVEQIIRIDSGIVSAQKAAETLLHEISHAIYSRYGVSDEDKEERIVGQFATGWLQVYQDNPSLLVWVGRCCAAR